MTFKKAVRWSLATIATLVVVLIACLALFT
jgi:uncharacterized membrane protein